MPNLFCIATDQFQLKWDRVRDLDHAVLARSLPVMGQLQIRDVAKSLKFSKETRRVGVADKLALDLDHTVGPPLYEQTDYQIFASTVDPKATISIKHRDPFIEQSLSSQEGGRIAHGVVNFRNQVGRTLFSVLVNGQRMLDFEVEVFPTKVDYETDYQEILTDVQSILTGLAYEYLRSTYQLGKAAPGAKPSRLEWLVLVEQSLAKLESALHHIAQRPIRGLMRNERLARAERVRKIDSRILAQVRRGQGHGELLQVGRHAVRERLMQRPPELTLNTIEHRWLRRQLEDVQRTLGILTATFDRDDELSERKRRAIELMTNLKSRVARLLSVEPIQAAEGDVPAGFASLQLISAPGYREAFRLLMFLRMGLRLEGDLYKLAIKDLDLLYEYWSYLKVAQVIREDVGAPKDLDSFFKIGLNGLGVRLRKGESQKLTFASGPHRQVSVLYNPTFANQETTLIPQKPDILIRLEDNGWPRVQLVCDAKYRVDATEKYRQQFGSYGPPVDAINVLHRYRDAILELDDSDSQLSAPKRSVVQAAALFPLNRLAGDPDFCDSRLWKSIEKIGVGAIPLLPGNDHLLRQWIGGALRRGGWAFADKAIGSLVDSRARDWRVAASEPVLIGVLRSPGTREHLNWIKRERVYYQPRTKSQRRQFAVKQVAIYVPVGLDEPSGIRYVSDVEQIDVVERKEIKTPWASRQNGEVVLYRLGAVRLLKRPIELMPGETMAGRWRWTTRLGLERATNLRETGLETEPEWRLWEWLQVNRLIPEIRVESPNMQTSEDPRGRAWFHLKSGDSIRFDGSNGFLLKRPGLLDRYLTLDAIAHELQRTLRANR